MNEPLLLKITMGVMRKKHTTEREREREWARERAKEREREREWARERAGEGESGWESGREREQEREEPKCTNTISKVSLSSNLAEGSLSPGSDTTSSLSYLLIADRPFHRPQSDQSPTTRRGRQHDENNNKTTK